MHNKCATRYQQIIRNTQETWFLHNEFSVKIRNRYPGPLFWTRRGLVEPDLITGCRCRNLHWLGIAFRATPFAAPGHGFDHLKELQAHLRIGDRVVVADQLNGLGLLQARVVMSRAFSEEERDRHAERIRNGEESRGADAIGAMLIFLDLLKREAKRGSQIRLVHAKEEPPRPDAPADMHVGWVWHATAAAVSAHRLRRRYRGHMASLGSACSASHRLIPLFGCERTKRALAPNCNLREREVDECLTPAQASSHDVPMRALFECRLEHIGKFDRVKVECACGREVLLSLEAFAGLPSDTRVLDLKRG